MKKNLIIFISAFVLLFVISGLMSLGLNYEEKQKDSLIHLASELGAKKMKEETVDFLKNDSAEILQKFNVTNRKGELVSIIYVGSSTGYKENLKVAYAIDVKTHKVVGMKIVESNETPRFLDALYANETWLKQFKNKDLNEAVLTIEVFSGATPNGGNGVVAPFTNKGMDEILKLVRKQYDKDTDFEAPEEIVLLSSRQNYEDLSQFIYEFKIVEETITAVVDRSYNLVSISNNEFSDLILTNVLLNKLTTYVDEALFDADNDLWTVKVVSKCYYGNVTSTATLSSDGTIESFKTDLSNEIKQNNDGGYYSGYNANSFNSIFDAIKNKTEFSALSGATVTSKSIIDAKNTLYSFIEGGLGNE